MINEKSILTQRYISNVFIRLGFSLIAEGDGDDNVAEDVCVCCIRTYGHHKWGKTNEIIRI